MPYVLSCDTVDQFKQSVEDGKSKKLTVIYFTAPWSGPCRFISPFVSELANKYEDVLFLKVDVGELKTVADEFGAQAMPTFVFLKEGNVVDKLESANKDTLLMLVTKYSG